MKTHVGAYESPLYENLDLANEEIIRLRSKLILQNEQMLEIKMKHLEERKSLLVQLRKHQRLAQGLDLTSPPEVCTKKP